MKLNEWMDFNWGGGVFTHLTEIYLSVMRDRTSKYNDIIFNTLINYKNAYRYFGDYEIIKVNCCNESETLRVYILNKENTDKNDGCKF